MNNSQLDIITVLSLALTLYALEIAFKNLDENRIQSYNQQDLLNYLEQHLTNQDEHLKAQDELMQTQAEHLENIRKEKQNERIYKKDS